MRRAFWYGHHPRRCASLSADAAGCVGMSMCDDWSRIRGQPDCRSVCLDRPRHSPSPAASRSKPEACPPSPRTLLRKTRTFVSRALPARSVFLPPVVPAFSVGNASASPTRLLRPVGCRLTGACSATASRPRASVCITGADVDRSSIAGRHLIQPGRALRRVCAPLYGDARSFRRRRAANAASLSGAADSAVIRTLIGSLRRRRRDKGALAEEFGLAADDGCVAAGVAVRRCG